jgi:hypothetical protein
MINAKLYRCICQHVPVLGDLCKWLDDTSIYRQPAMSLSHALPFIGAVIGRRVGFGNLRTNLYCLNIAPPGAGKGHAPNALRKVAMQCGCTALIGSYDIASDTALMKALLQQPAMVCFWDEISFMLKGIRQSRDLYVAKIRPLLMQLYSQADTYVRCKARALDESTPTLVNPCFSFCGSSVLESLTSALSYTELLDGWWPRCLYFVSERPQQKQIYPGSELQALPPVRDIPEAVIHFVRSYVEPVPEEVCCISPGEGETMMFPKVLQAHVDNSAVRVFRGLNDYANERCSKDPITGTLWIRADENARRIALIIGACESVGNDLSIGTSAAYMACEIVRNSILDFEQVVMPTISVDDIQMARTRVLRAIREATTDHGYATMKDIASALSNQQLRKHRRVVIEELVDRGDITVISRVHKGATRVAFIPAGSSGVAK